MGEVRQRLWLRRAVAERAFGQHQMPSRKNPSPSCLLMQFARVLSFAAVAFGEELLLDSTWR